MAVLFKCSKKAKNIQDGGLLKVILIHIRDGLVSQVSWYQENFTEIP